MPGRNDGIGVQRSTEERNGQGPLMCRIKRIVPFRLIRHTNSLNIVRPGRYPGPNPVRIAAREWHENQRPSGLRAALKPGQDLCGRTARAFSVRPESENALTYLCWRADSRSQVFHLFAICSRYFFRVRVTGKSSASRGMPAHNVRVTWSRPRAVAIVLMLGHLITVGKAASCPLHPTGWYSG